MKTRYLTALALAFLGPMTAPAQDTQIKDTFVCITHQFHLCALYGGCRDLHPVEINAPDFWKFELKKNEITARRHDGTYGSVKIESVERMPEMIMIQGVMPSTENFAEGVAWSIGVHKQTGRMSVAVSAHAEVLAMLGSCHAL